MFGVIEHSEHVRALGTWSWILEYPRPCRHEPRSQQTNSSSNSNVYR